MRLHEILCIAAISVSIVCAFPSLSLKPSDDSNRTGSNRIGKLPNYPETADGIGSRGNKNGGLVGEVI